MPSRNRIEYCECCLSCPKAYFKGHMSSFCIACLNKPGYKDAELRRFNLQKTLEQSQNGDFGQRQLQRGHQRQLKYDEFLDQRGNFFDRFYKEHPEQEKLLPIGDESESSLFCAQTLGSGAYGKVELCALSYKYQPVVRKTEWTSEHARGSLELEHYHLTQIFDT